MNSFVYKVRPVPSRSFSNRWVLRFLIGVTDFVENYRCTSHNFSRTCQNALDMRRRRRNVQYDYRSYYNSIQPLLNIINTSWV